MSSDILVNLYIFVLATFLGLEVIRRVSPLLHTPLMSLTNAISAITVVGSMVIAGKQETTLSTVLGTVAVTASMINIVGGYLITYRMLAMFKKREPKKMP
ncbi:MAG: NAD(P) transhydrogenase subunit alpha [Kiritimatiellaeota bacterium]|nr:NAD(P) transhydrogenase subunit alpha [Kiritimatiellota bacterium]